MTKAILISFLTLALLGLLASCVTVVGEPAADPWAGVDPGDTYYLADGSRMTVEEDGVRTVDLQVREGHLWLNGDDLGAYDETQGIRFLRDGRLTVDGATRGSLHAR